MSPLVVIALIGILCAAWLIADVLYVRRQHRQLRQNNDRLAERLRDYGRP